MLCEFHQDLFKKENISTSSFVKHIQFRFSLNIFKIEKNTWAIN